MKRSVILVFLLSILTGLFLSNNAYSARILIPMDESQKDHLKAYGITYWVLENGATAEWLLNYRGGSFSLPYKQAFEKECNIRGISYKVLADAQN